MTTAGSYVVTYTVVDENESSSSASRTVNVLAPPVQYDYEGTYTSHPSVATWLGKGQYVLDLLNNELHYYGKSIHPDSPRYLVGTVVPGSFGTTTPNTQYVVTRDMINFSNAFVGTYWALGPTDLHGVGDLSRFVLSLVTNELTYYGDVVGGIEWKHIVGTVEPGSFVTPLTHGQSDYQVTADQIILTSVPV
jgi:hypothetical protein